MRFGARIPEKVLPGADSPSDPQADDQNPIKPEFAPLYEINGFARLNSYGGNKINSTKQLASLPQANGLEPKTRCTFARTRHPDLSRLREGGRQTARRDAEPMTGSGTLDAGQPLR